MSDAYECGSGGAIGWLPTGTRLVREPTLETDVACSAVLVDDHPHGDAAGRADRRAFVVGERALLFHVAQASSRHLDR